MKGPKELDEYLQEFSACNGFWRPSPLREPSRERDAVASYLTTWDSKWYQLIAALANVIPPMPAETRCVIFVPARFEERRIRGLLDAVYHETRELCEIKPGMLEVLVLDNCLESEEHDGTSEVVAEWCTAWQPRFPVHCLRHKWHPTEREYAVAFSRKLLADLVLLRALLRESYQSALYLLSEDADTCLTQIGRTARFIAYLDSHPQVDAVCGIEERERAALAKNDLLLLDRRTWFFSEILLSARAYSPAVRWNADFHWNRIVTPGANFCISAETYALIRGYSTDVRIFEDMDIGQRVSVLRGGWANGRFVPNVSTIRRLPIREESSAARAILALARGASDPYDGGAESSTFFNNQIEQTVRNQDPDSLLERIRGYAQITDANKHRFEEVLSMHYREVVRILRVGTLGRRVFARVLWLLGFVPGDYKMQESKVVLLRVGQFRRLAKRFEELISARHGYVRYEG